MACKKTDHVILPLTLNSPLFVKAWDDYLNYRRQSGMRKLIPMSVQRQWDQLSDYGVEIAIKAIDQSIAQGWQGLFPDRCAIPPGGSNPKGVRGDGKDREGFSSLGALQMRLKEINEELESIYYPGGCAFKVVPSNQKQGRANDLLEQRSRIKIKIEKF